jgi:site-specific DNA recombinase
MRIVRRIFHMVGAEGQSLNSVKKVFDNEGVPTPKGSRYWGNTFIQRVITDDAYRPHSLDEVGALVSQEVASRLDPNERYGVWWFNRRRRIEKQVSVPSQDGRRYLRRSSTTEKPKEEWIAVPVPDAGIPREWVDAARSHKRQRKVQSRRRTLLGAIRPYEMLRMRLRNARQQPS